jgi:hypothetical protein
MAIEDVLLLLATLLIAGLGAVVANWIKPPAGLSQKVFIFFFIVLLAVSAALSYYAGRRGASPKPVITSPAPNDVVDRHTALTGVLPKSLAEGHQVWAEVHAHEEFRFHPAEQPCQVIDYELLCPQLVVGEESEVAGKAFVITLYDANPAAVKHLEVYARRPKTAPNAYRGMEKMPDGSNPMTAVIVQRR